MVTSEQKHRQFILFPFAVQFIGLKYKILNIYIYIMLVFDNDNHNTINRSYLNVRFF